MRASVCQFLGTVLGLVTASAVGTAYGNFGAPVTGSRATDLLAIAFVALIAIGLPLFALVMLLLSAFTPQILRSPFLWCIAAPAVLTALGLWVFPVTAYHGLLWIAVIQWKPTALHLDHDAMSRQKGMVVSMQIDHVFLYAVRN